MKSIELKNAPGVFAYVDDDDYERLSQWAWLLACRSELKYAVRYESNKAILLHRAVLSAASGDLVDHRDGNGLNNSRSNLRFCTHTQNLHNSVSRVGSSRFKGVHRATRSNRKWVAQISVNKTKIRLRGFDSEEAAARAYDSLARQYFGEFARPNFAEAA